MEEQQSAKKEEQPFYPDMLWEGYMYLAFFVFFCIYLIPNTPRSWSFGRYYPIAMITYGAAGVLVGRIAYIVTRKMPWWVKTAIVGILYALVIYYLLTHVHKFSVQPV